MKAFRSYVHLKNYRDYLPREVADIIKCFEIALIREECGHIVFKQTNKLFKNSAMKRFSRIDRLIKSNTNSFMLENPHWITTPLEQTITRAIRVKSHSFVLLQTTTEHTKNQPKLHNQKAKYQPKAKPQNHHHKTNFIIHQPRK